MKTLYNNLKALTLDEATPFYSSIQVASNTEVYEIFSYHFTDRDSWGKPDALEARGIMFEVDHKTMEPIRLAARPMPKFFNEEETVVEYSDPVYAMNKADGSLISSYADQRGDIKLKSKTSIASDYALLAMELLDADAELKDWVTACDRVGYTVNMELVSPDPKFRIVLHYAETKLIVLNVRHRETGKYMFDNIPKKYFAGTVSLEKLKNLENETNIEGYVVIDINDNWYKKKCGWYLTRHRAKDFVNRPDAFIELVLKDEADDVFSLLADQPEILKEMEELQHAVVEKSNRIINTVSEYWIYNYKLDRKEYAIKGKADLSPLEFPLAMKYYTTGTEPDWNKFLLGWIKKIEWSI